MYIVEGNIGAGKTTLLKFIAENIPEITVSYEPVDDWQKKVHGQSLLANFYQDPKRWAYTMETFAMLSRVREHLRDQNDPNPFHLIERSIYSGHYCFALNGYRNHFLTPLEWDMYCSWFNYLIPGKCLPPRGFIYLRVSPEVAYERLKRRARDAESCVPLDYIVQIDKCHEDFLIKKEGVMSDLIDVPVLVLDGDPDFEENKTLFQNLINQIKEFLFSTSLN